MMHNLVPEPPRVAFRKDDDAAVVRVVPAAEIVWQASRRVAARARHGLRARKQRRHPLEPRAFFDAHVLARLRIAAVAKRLLFDDRKHLIVIGKGQRGQEQQRRDRCDPEGHGFAAAFRTVTASSTVLRRSLPPATIPLAWARDSSIVTASSKSIRCQSRSGVLSGFLKSAVTATTSRPSCFSFASPSVADGP